MRYALTWQQHNAKRLLVDTFYTQEQ
jgi:hypothetical protein